MKKSEAECGAQLKPREIMNDVLRVLRKRNTHVTAYQILNQLPASLRSRLVSDYGLPGAGGGHRFTADTAVSQAGDMLVKRGRADWEWLYTRDMRFICQGKVIQAGNPWSRFYRARGDHKITETAVPNHLSQSS